MVFDLDNIIEARIFNETCEIKIWRYDNIMRGSIFKEIKPNNIMEDEYILYPRETGGYSPSKLFVKKYIDYDSDGQAYISYIKPSKII